MESNWLTTVGFSASVIAIGYACYSMLQNLYKPKNRNAVEAYKYLNIEIITTESQCFDFIQILRSKLGYLQAVGFDCEWVTEGKRRYPVALIQLSSNDGLCGLIRLTHLKKIPECLKRFLEDELIYKVGVAPLDDAKYLYQDYGVILKSTLDLRHIAQLCGYIPDGLASLAKQILGVVLDKHWHVRCSDWENEDLTDRQIIYAAVDAHVAIQMFYKMIMQIEKMGLSVFTSVLYKYIDIRFKVPQRDADSKKKIKNSSHVTLESKRYPHATRSKPLYHNCYLQAPDGELLCTCDNKKALWYVEKALGEVVEQQPLTVRLRFEPAGRSVGDAGRYYQLKKQNRCVVCGATDSYIRKNVVPREYRKFFPEVMKEHSSHDVVLLCAPCHMRSNLLDQPVRAALAARCGAPLSSADNNRFIEDADIKKVRSAANALLHQAKRHALPAARRRHLEDIVREHFHQELTEELLEEASELHHNQENSNYESHGAKVVEHFARGGGGLLRLEREWREHFLAAMQPRYLPELWSLTHNEDRLPVRCNVTRQNCAGDKHASPPFQLGPPEVTWRGTDGSVYVSGSDAISLYRLRVRFEEDRLSEEDLNMLGLTHWIQDRTL